MSQAALASIMGQWLPQHMGPGRAEATDVWGRTTAGSTLSAMKGVCTVAAEPGQPLLEIGSPGLEQPGPRVLGMSRAPAERKFPMCACHAICFLL